MKYVIKIFCTPKGVIALAIISLCLGGALIWGPFGAEQLRELSGGIGPLDMNITYSSDMAFTALKNMGYIGQVFYKNWLYLDFVNALLSLFFETAFITLLINKLLLCWRWRFLNFLPVIKFLSDCVENILCLFMLFQYPDQSPIAAGIAGYMTPLKWVALSVTLVSVIGLSSAIGVKALGNIIYARKN